MRVQDVLKEIERAHFANSTTNREESSEKFNEWLISQGFPKRDQNTNSIFIGGNQQQRNDDDAKKSVEQESNETAAKSEQKTRGGAKSKRTRVKKAEKDWNYSTKPVDKEYTTDLNDFYPRDPFTQLPENMDLVMLNRELRGTTKLNIYSNYYL